MPQYFFHLRSPEGRSHDDIGVELSDTETAYLEAHRAALDISMEMLREHRDPSRHRFEITDADGQLMFDLPFTEVMRPSRPLGPAGRIHANLRLRQQRTAKIVSELRGEFDHTRSLLAETRALLARSRG